MTKLVNLMYIYHSVLKCRFRDPKLMLYPVMDQSLKITFWVHEV